MASILFFIQASLLVGTIIGHQLPSITEYHNLQQQQQPIDLNSQPVQPEPKKLAPTVQPNFISAVINNNEQVGRQQSSYPIFQKQRPDSIQMNQYNQPYPQLDQQNGMPNQLQFYSESQSSQHLSQNAPQSQNSQQLIMPVQSLGAQSLRESSQGNQNKRQYPYHPDSSFQQNMQHQGPQQALPGQPNQQQQKNVLPHMSNQQFEPVQPGMQQNPQFTPEGHHQRPQTIPQQMQGQYTMGKRIPDDQNAYQINQQYDPQRLWPQGQFQNQGLMDKRVPVQFEPQVMHGGLQPLFQSQQQGNQQVAVALGSSTQLDPNKKAKKGNPDWNNQDGSSPNWSMFRPSVGLFVNKKDWTGKDYTGDNYLNQYQGSNGGWNGVFSNSKPGGNIVSTEESNQGNSWQNYNNYPNYQFNGYGRGGGCASSPCLNGGKCTTTGVYGYHCNCPYTMYGPRCEHRNGTEVLIICLSVILPLFGLVVIGALAFYFFFYKARTTYRK